jgi:dipeptidyl aminopeptidase/acylaminoacyl peptidase
MGNPLAPVDLQGTAAALVSASNGKIAIAANPFAGSTLFVPANGRVRGGIVFLHGSEGGDRGGTLDLAANWASVGFAALSYSYFGVPGADIPAKLGGVELRRTIKAIEWLKRSSHLKGGKKVGLWGGSRGAEQALLVASVIKDPSILACVAAHAPASKTGDSLDWDTMDSVYDEDRNRLTAWQLDAKPIEDGIPIPVERYLGPIYIEAGTRDEIWPSAQYTREIEQRLTAAGKSAEIHIVQGERHGFSDATRERTGKLTYDFFTRNLEG